MDIVKLFLFIFIIFYVFEDITASHLYVGKQNKILSI